MDFPLYTDTYVIKGRIYRRNPFKKFKSDMELELGGGDTLDLYGSDQIDSDCYETPETYFASQLSGKICNYESTGGNKDVQSLNQSDTDGGSETHQRLVPTVLPAGSESEEGSVSRTVSAIKYNSKSKKWRALMNVPNKMRGFIIGYKGTMLKKLEIETKCRISFPKKGEEKKPIEIVTSSSSECIQRCVDRIELIMIRARENWPYSHFVSLRMNQTDIQGTVSQFIEAVLADDEIHESCRHPHLFQRPAKVHFTLVMLSLLDESEESIATSILQSLVDTKVAEILGGGTLEIEVKNLAYMNDDPSSVSVLYARGFSDKLSVVANAIAEAFTESGLAPRQSNELKMHMTLMNAGYCKDLKCQKFDARNLIKKYGEFYFGHVPVQQIHISSRRNAEEDYKSIATIDLK